MDTIQFHAVVGLDQVIRPPAGVALPEGDIEVIVHFRTPKTPDPLAATRSWLLALAEDAERAAEPALRYGREPRPLRPWNAAAMSEIFADAFYYIALLNPSDKHHATAIHATKSLQHPMVTTLWVLMETADALSAPAVRLRTHRFLEGVGTDPSTTVIADAEPWFTRGLDLYGQRPDKDWSLTDCISFAVMADRGIIEALTGDHHFTQAGFQTLLK